MKKLIYLCSLLIASASAMEQNQPDPKVWQELLPELKNEILTKIVQAPNMATAISSLKKVMQINKQFSNTSVVNMFLDVILQKFPGQEIRIANLMRNPIADLWLSKNLNNTYKRKATRKEDVSVGQNALMDVIVDKTDVIKVRAWLEMGYNPTFLLPLAIAIQSIDALKLLFFFGADINYIAVSGREPTDGSPAKKLSLLEIAQEVKQSAIKLNQPIDEIDEIIEFLKNEQPIIQ